MNSWFQTFVIMSTYIQVVTFILSLVFWMKYKHTNLKSLPYYFGFVAFVELFCFHFYRQDNVWVYNALTIIQTNYFCYLFFPYVGRLFKNVIVGMAVLFNLSIIYIFTSKSCDFVLDSCPYAYVLGVFILLIIMFVVFIRILSDNSEMSFSRNLLFWLCFGFLLFYATSLPLFSISNWSELLGKYDRNIPMLLFFSVLVSNLLLISGFIWSKKKYTY